MDPILSSEQDTAVAIDGHHSSLNNVSSGV